MENTKEKEITLKTLFDVLKKCYIVMIIAAVALGAVAAAVVAFAVKPSYKANATFWVTSSSSDYDYASSAQTAAASAIASSCVELVKEDLPVRRAVQYGNLTEKLGYTDENKCVQEIREMISATKKESGSFIFYITVEGDNKEYVSQIAIALKSVMPEVMDELLKLKQNDDNAPILRSIGPDAPEVETVRTSPVKTFALVAIVVAVVVYLVYFIISIFDTGVYNEDSIKENFTQPILGTVPNWANGNEKEKKKIKRNRKSRRKDASIRDYKGRLLSETKLFGITEAFNQLRTNIIYSAGGKGCPVIAITSAVAGVGKSLLSSNLALSFSALGKRVLLVETDMRCPSLSRIFGGNSDAGLSEILAGIESDDKNVTVKVCNGAFDVIYSGKIPPNPSELLSGIGMSDALARWRERYDFILLDTAPIGAVVDAGVVAGFIDGYVIAVRSEFSDVNELRRAVDSIEAVNGKILGFILNDYNPKSSKKYKRGYYNYENGYAKQDSEN